MPVYLEGTPLTRAGRRGRIVRLESVLSGYPSIAAGVAGNTDSAVSGSHIPFSGLGGPRLSLCHPGRTRAYVGPDGVVGRSVDALSSVGQCQIGWASSVNATATRRAGLASIRSS